MITRFKAFILGALLAFASPSVWAFGWGTYVLEVGLPVQYYLYCDYDHDEDDYQEGFEKLWYKCATFTGHQAPSAPGNGQWPANDPLGVPGATHNYFHYWYTLAGTQSCRVVGWKNWYSYVFGDADGDGNIDGAPFIDQVVGPLVDSHYSDGECPDPG